MAAFPESENRRVQATGLQYRMIDLSEIAHRLLEEAVKAGADAADSIVVDEQSVNVDVRNGALENAERSESASAGLRVFAGSRQACVSGSDIRPGSLIEMAIRAVEMAREAPEDPFAGLANPDQLSGGISSAGLELIDDTPQPHPQALEEFARRAEASALKVRGVSKAESASAGCGNYRVSLAATNGFSGSYHRGSHYMSCVAITGSGLDMEQDYCFENRVFASDMPAPEEIGRIAGERAVAKAGPKKPKTGAFPVLFDERVAGGLIGHLLSAANGAAVARGSSWLLDTLGSRILPKGMDVAEDPLRPRSMSSRPFDAEGLATSRLPIVSDGILQTWILDLASARKLGFESTGNAARGIAAPPRPSVTNIDLTESGKSRGDLMREMNTGVLVTSMIGATINQNTGDYSRGASGFWIEKGEIAYPVSEFTIAGNLKEMLGSLVPANDSRQFTSYRVPSLLVEGMVIAGA